MHTRAVWPTIMYVNAVRYMPRLIIIYACLGALQEGALTGGEEIERIHTGENETLDACAQVRMCVRVSV